MPTVIVENMPMEVYERLQQRAAADRRSLPEEVLHLVREALQETAPSPRLPDLIPGEEIPAPCDLPRSSQPVGVVQNTVAMSETLSHAMSAPSSTPASDLERKFLTLAETWTRETAHLSSTQQMTEHPAYREIVSLGRPVVPLIFKALLHEPGFHWFHALRDILGSGPEIPTEARGRLRPVTECWLRWGKEHGIAW